MFRSSNEKIEVKRVDETVDIVKRIGVITADRVHLTNYPRDNPVMIFNPASYIEDEALKIYGRIVLGYFTYASAIIELTVPVEELSDVSVGHYSGRIVVKPDNKFDIWGVEDPRFSVVKGKKVLTYCGRTLNYFSTVKFERTVPVIAVSEDDQWRKICAFRIKGYNVVSDKDAFLQDIGGVKLFHRIHTLRDEFYCVIGEVPKDILEKRAFSDIFIRDEGTMLKCAEFEEKIGWGTPAVKIGKEYVMLLHAVDKDMKWYRVFAVSMDKEAELRAVTSHYIMEPRENYEVYGDRPFVVFPCGLCRLDDKLIVSYGAADSAVGIGEIDISELMSILDSNRL